MAAIGRCAGFIQKNEHGQLHLLSSGKFDMNALNVVLGGYEGKCRDLIKQHMLSYECVHDAEQNICLRGCGCVYKCGDEAILRQRTVHFCRGVYTESKDRSRSRIFLAKKSTVFRPAGTEFPDARTSEGMMR